MLISCISSPCGLNFALAIPPVMKSVHKGSLETCTARLSIHLLSDHSGGIQILGMNMACFSDCSGCLFLSKGEGKLFGVLGEDSGVSG